MKPAPSAPLARALMTFHHIRAPRKKRFIKEHTKLHSLRGVCKVGQPGILVLVGQKEGCEAVVRAIKKLTWASCHLRKLTCDVDPSTLNMKDDGGPWLLKGKAVGCEMVEKMAEIGRMVREAGWEDWWRKGMSQGA